MVTQDTGISAVSREERRSLGDGGNAPVLLRAGRAVAGARGSRVVQRVAGIDGGLKSGVRSTGVGIPGDLLVRSEATIIVIALGNVQADGVGVASRLGQIMVTCDRAVRVGTADLGGLVIRGGGGGAAHEGDEGDGADHDEVKCANSGMCDVRQVRCVVRTLWCAKSFKGRKNMGSLTRSDFDWSSWSSRIFVERIIAE